MILNIDTTTKNCSVNIVHNGYSIILIEEYLNNFNHIEKLHNFIKFALEGAKIKISSLNAICINKGPGSYTGIRIASSTAKGLCFILKIPLISVDIMTIMIQNLCIEDKTDYLIMTVITNKNGSIYNAIFNKKKNIVKPINKCMLNNFTLKHYYNKKFYIIGDNINKYMEYNNINYKYLYKYNVSSFNMTNISEKYFKKKQFENIENFTPIYL